VVATNETVLATGKGPAEAHQTMANSFWAEGYGAASALLFVTAYSDYQTLHFTTRIGNW
jgi:hypothetical protein